MRRSETLLFTSRDADSHENETVARTLRAGLIRQFGSGLYGFTPTGQRVRENVVSVVQREMDAIGGQRIGLPSLNASEVWRRSGRWESFEGEMFTVENRDGKRMCLAPSHEEGVAHLVDGIVRSYDDLPLLLYQVETKYRDDHARNGLVRTKEFTMKDAYSLHASRDSLAEYYDGVREAYVRIFDALDLEFAITTAANSIMGGSSSEEFVAVADEGTVALRWCPATDCRFGVTDESPRSDLSAGDACPDCGRRLEAGEGIEIGHVFELGTRYSEPMDLTIDTADGGERDVVMGSYGIGIERLVHTLVEQHGDEDGCRWPDTAVGTVGPFDIAIVPLEYDGDLREVADQLYERLEGDVLLFDDTDRTIGERFAESDLLGVPWKVILGNRYRETGEVELESRTGDTRDASPAEVPGIVGSSTK
ncbi:proline--tRNA ligase [Natronorubrum sp. JWXQ-INN-674]|uniref:proline--tRNA ligase n=1 Tax=Natronorubrum halalkaliphilum TaxID=2691917 RepID=A0A6B0VQZ1_9EURY|nr:aminoacyl--tRNA ligase-related protein [Natronorubrum halalkaliphilum]MXV63745.1 proline--tRNA ligase [Natronorubrum halalkaliphilum]